MTSEYAKDRKGKIGIIKIVTRAILKSNSPIMFSAGAYLRVDPQKTLEKNTYHRESGGYNYIAIKFLEPEWKA